MEATVLLETFSLQQTFLIAPVSEHRVAWFLF